MGHSALLSSAIPLLSVQDVMYTFSGRAIRYTSAAALTNAQNPLHTFPRNFPVDGKVAFGFGRCRGQGQSVHQGQGALGAYLTLPSKPIAVVRTT